eukprot:4097445-Lingulodinium_polyedra.AAC.1
MDNPVALPDAFLPGPPFEPGQRTPAVALRATAKTQDGTGPLDGPIAEGLLGGLFDHILPGLHPQTARV